MGWSRRERWSARARLVLASEAVLLALAPAQVQAQGPWGQGPSEWPFGGMHWMWGMWGVGMAIGMLVFWGLIIAGLVLAVRWLATQGRPPREADRPLDILKRRYARGEISREEFEAMKRELA